MSSLRVYACGGAGINLANLWMKTGKSAAIKQGLFVGTDTSENNIPDGDSFPIEHRHGLRGGAKIRQMNYEGTAEFIDDVLTRHKPADFNIVVYSTSGSTGGIQGPTIVQRLLKQRIPVVSVIIVDQASQKEASNTSATFQSLDNFRKSLKVNVVFDYIDNADFRTRGMANQAIVDRMDYLSLFLTDQHVEADYADVSTLLRANEPSGTPATLCRVTFHKDWGEDQKAEGNPVAGMSLFKNGDDVANIIPKLAYRVTGVMNPNISPSNFSDIHMLLEFDDTIKHIQQLIADTKDRELQSKQRFMEADSISDDEGDDIGMVM